MAFTTKCVGNVQQMAALAIIKTGPANMGLAVTESRAPLLDGEDTMIRQTTFQVMSNIHEICERYWNEVEGALIFIGVEVTSP